MLIHKKKKSFLKRKALLIFPLFLCIFTFPSFEAQGCFEELENNFERLRKHLFEEDPEMANILNAMEEGRLSEEEVIRSLAEQLDNDLFPKKTSWGEWIKDNSLATLFGGGSSYILSILLANDGAVDDLFKILTDGQAITLGSIVLSLHLLSEIMHAKKNIRSFKHWWNEKDGLRKQNSKKLRRFTEGAVWLLASGLTFKMLRLYLDVGYVGSEDWWELALCGIFFLPQTLTKSVSGMKNILNKMWDKLSRGSTSQTCSDRKEILEQFSNSYRMIKDLPTENLLDAADMISKIANSTHDEEHRHLLILALLHSLYHMDEENNHWVAPGNHPFGYNLSRWIGGTLGLISTPLLYLSGKYVMAQTLGLVQGKDADSYTPDWTGWQNTTVYGYAIGIGGYAAGSALLALSKKISGFYCYFTGYDPNARNKVLEPHENTLSGLRGGISLLNFLVTAGLSMPSVGLSGTGLYLEGLEDVNHQIPLLIFAALAYGGILDESFDDAIQYFITLSIELKKTCGSPNSEKFKDLEGQLRDSFRKLLVTITAYVKKLPDDKIEALSTLMDLEPDALEARLRNISNQTAPIDEEVIILDSSSSDNMIFSDIPEDVGIDLESGIIPDQDLSDIYNQILRHNFNKDDDVWREESSNSDFLDLGSSGTPEHSDEFDDIMIQMPNERTRMDRVKDGLYNWWQNRSYWYLPF